jgi:methyl-accepting chemotaxis protein
MKTPLLEKNDHTTTVEMRIERLARSSIALSKLAPELTAIASRLAEGSTRQATQSREIAANVDRMADELARAMDALNVSSSGVGEIVSAIKRVADQTRILSINASIEAARAGEMGLAFGAVAKEVESLANQTSGATKQISTRVDVIKSNINSAVDAAGLAVKDGTTDAGGKTSIRHLGSEVNDMARIATETAEAANSVDDTSKRIRDLCESLLLEVGAFRLPVHERAMNLFRQLLGKSEFSSGNRAAYERVMRDAIRNMHIFELLYLTDADGRQISSNLWEDGREDASVFGKDWSSRPWFTSVVSSGELSVSDIYRSSATDSFCFTLSGPIFDNEGNFVGVLAADVNFANLLGH